MGKLIYAHLLRYKNLYVHLYVAESCALYLHKTKFVN